MAERRPTRIDATAGASDSNDSTPSDSDKISERLYADYRRLRLELARLRKDVRRLTEESEAGDDAEEPAGDAPEGGAAAGSEAQILLLRPQVDL